MRGLLAAIAARTSTALAALALALIVATVALTVPPLAPAAAAPGDLQVALTEIAPAVLQRTDQDVTVTGTITNTTNQPITEPVIRLRMQRAAVGSTGSLERWLDGTTPVSGNVPVMSLTQLDADVPPGASVPFSASIPANTFSQQSAWGPRGIEVQITSGDLYAAVRNVILWFPADAELLGRTELSVLMPLTPTVTEWARSVREGTPVAQVAAPRIADLVAATSGTEVSWGLDPALLEEPAAVEPSDDTSPEDAASTPADAASASRSPSAEPSTGTGTGTTSPSPTPESTPTTPGTAPTTDQGETANEGEAPPSGRGSLSELLRTEGGDRDVVGLAYADADLSALTRHDGGPLVAAGDAASAALLEEHAITALEGVRWPADDVDDATLSALAQDGAQAVVLPAGVVDNSPDTHTPAGRASVGTEAGPLDAVLWNEVLSELLAGETNGTSLDDLTARQHLLAYTAVITREHPDTARGFLAALPRDFAPDEATLTALRERLDALAAAPWLDVTTLRALLGRSDDGVSAIRADAEPASGSLTSDDVAELTEDWTTLASFTEIATTPDEALAGARPALLSTLSQAWRERAGARTALIADVAAEMEELRSQIRVAPGSSVLLVNAESEMPITVTSSLDFDATVVVQLEPQNPSLQADESVRVTLPAGQSTTVRVPVTAVANGNVDVDVRVLAGPGGEAVAPVSTFAVRVRADWENIGTVIVASLLFVGFVIGLVRTIRRARRRRAEAAGSGSTEAAASGSAGPDVPAPDAAAPGVTS